MQAMQWLPLHGRDPLKLCEVEMAPSEVETATRIVRLETKIDFIIDKIDRLPPSPVCVAKHKEIDVKFDDVEKWRNRLIGVILVVNILFVIMMDKIRAVLFPQ